MNTLGTLWLVLTKGNFSSSDKTGVYITEKGWGTSDLHDKTAHSEHSPTRTVCVAQ